jgi:hypothetical protein
MMDLSVILISNKPKELARAVEYFREQTYRGIAVEFVVVQCLDKGNRSGFTQIGYPPLAKIRQIDPPHNNYFDNAAAARDFGLKESCGQYVVFWDDDNIYFSHYLATLFTAAYGHDMAVARIHHSEHIIGDQIAPGRIDTMCVCVKRELAEKFQWYDGGGGYNDYRWIRHCSESSEVDINFVPVIVGKHL